MSFEHWEFPWLPVYDGGAGEGAVAGAFYRPKQWDNLSKISRSAYGDPTLWRKINNSAWNRAHTICGDDSTNCGGSHRKSWSTPGKKYIRLCPQADGAKLDALGNPDNVLWIPPAANDLEPIDMPSPQAPEAPSPPSMTLIPIAPPSERTTGGRTVTPTGPQRTAPSTGRQAGPSSTAFFQPSGAGAGAGAGVGLDAVDKAGFPWWILLVAVGVGGIAWIATRKPKKSGGKKKGKRKKR